MRAHGFSLVELVVVLGIISALAFVSLPFFRPMFAEAHLLGAARSFQDNFRLAASTAVRNNVYTAIRFEEQPDGVFYAVYRDGNHNGVISADIRAGRDTLVAGPFPLAVAPVSVGFLPRVPAIPPEGGFLSGDAIRFGRSNMVSFSPFGTATPGTIYLAGDGAQAAVRVTGGTARVRTMIWRGRWREQ